MANYLNSRQFVDELFQRMEELNHTCDIRINISIEPHEKSLSTWLDYAERYLPSRVRAKDYRGLSMELYAMEQVGLNRYPFASSYPRLATLLSSFLGWTLSPRSIAQRWDDLNRLPDNEQLQLIVHFWQKITTSSFSVQIGSIETK